MKTKLDRRFALALTPAVLLVCAGVAKAQPQDVTEFAPVPQDRTMEVVNDGTKTIYQTGSAEALGLFPQSYPYDQDSNNPSNMFPTVYENARDSAGVEMPNTLASTPENPYNLHPDPVVSDLVNDNGPEEDLDLIIKRLEEAVFPDVAKATKKTFFKNGMGVLNDPRRGEEDHTGTGSGLLPPPAKKVDLAEVQMGIDILEGNPIPDRAYSGMALLHYKGPEMVKVVDPVTKTVDVHQVWARKDIMSDTMFIDPTAVLNEPWTVRYTIDIVDRGHEDFAPFVVYFDDPALRGGMAVPNVALDATFFPMEEGKRYIIELKMAPAKYWNLTYHWGWRVHPSRIQAIENARKAPGGKNIVQWERDIFGDAPSSSEEAKLAAIAMLADLSPSKRMWKAFREIRAMGGNGDKKKLQALVREAREAFIDWQDRTRLPRGVALDESKDITMVYMNDTLYGQTKGIGRQGQERWEAWRTRGATLHIKLYNADYFPHGYVNVDFGGLRGWENTFQNTLPVQGQGPWFTFGRANWMPNTLAPTMIPAADPAVVAAALGDEVNALSHRKGMYKKADQEANLEKLHKNGKFNLVEEDMLLGADSADAMTVGGLGEHEIEITYRYDPAKRLRFYQFDPFHHNTDIWSVH